MFSNSLQSHRYFLIGAAVLTQMCLGSLYAWSVFQTTLVEAYGWERFSSQIPFMVSVFVNPLIMPIAGRWQDKTKPSTVAVIGGMLLATGYITAGLVDIIAVNNEFLGILWLSLTYGVIGGAGIGFCYVVPVALLIKWFPERKGFFVGIAVAGFGGGSLLFLQLEDFLINTHPMHKIGGAFTFLGFLFLICILLSSSLFHNPSPAYLEEYCPDEPLEVTKGCEDVKPLQMLRTPKFWILWVAFAITASAGIMTIGNIKSFVISQLVPGSLAPVELSFISTSMGGVLAMFNATGRISWGGISDRFGRITTLLISFSFLGIGMTLFPLQSELLTITLGACLIGFTYGGNFALFPSIIADSYGTENIGVNYSLLFTSVSISGILGPLLAGFLPYEVVFPALGSLVLLVTVSIFLLNKFEVL